MTCRWIIDALLDYLEVELRPDERAAFEGHLNECAECTRYLRSYQETVRLGKSAYDAPEGEAPAELVRAILAALPRR